MSDETTSGLMVRVPVWICLFTYIDDGSAGIFFETTPDKLIERIADSAWDLFAEGDPEAEAEWEAKSLGERAVYYMRNRAGYDCDNEAVLRATFIDCQLDVDVLELKAAP